jgi:hypothetical protein
LLLVAGGIVALWLAQLGRTDGYPLAHNDPQLTPTSTLAITPTHVPGKVISTPITTTWQLDTLKSSGKYYLYKQGTDGDVQYQGVPSKFIEADALEPTEFASLHHSIPLTDYVGSRIRFSAYLKLENVTRGTGLWMEVLNSAAAPMRIDDMWNRRLLGTRDWKRYEVVLDVPEGSDYALFGVQLQGNGKVWVNGASVEVVGEDVAVTGDPPPYNLGFEEGEHGWSGFNPPGGSPPVSRSLKADLDRGVVHSGSTSAHFNSANLPKDAKVADNYSAISQIFGAEEFRGKRLRFSAYVKADGVDSLSGLWMRVSGMPTAEQAYDILLGYDDMNDRHIRGSSDWHTYDVVLDVPDEANVILMGLRFGGEGQVWIDDAKLEIVGDDVPTTGMSLHEAPGNLSFEAGLAGWYAYSSLPGVKLDSSLAHDGQVSASLILKETPSQGQVGLAQIVRAQQYWGKRVRVSAYIKGWESPNAQPESLYFTATAFGPGGMVRGESGLVATGPSDAWRRYEQVLDVPPGSLTIELRVWLERSGQIWVDDVRLEELGPAELTPTP